MLENVYYIDDFAFLFYPHMIWICSIKGTMNFIRQKVLNSFIHSHLNFVHLQHLDQNWIQYFASEQHV